MDLVILIVTCGVNLLLGLIVLLRDPKKIHVQLFTAVTILLCVWIISNYVTNHYTTNLTISNIANNIAFASGYGVLFAALLFTYVFPVRRKVSRLEIGIVVSIAIITIGLSMTESVAGYVEMDSDWKLFFGIGPLVGLYVTSFIVTLGLIARNLLEVRRQNRVIWRQAYLILVAFGITASVGLILNAVIPLLTGDWESTRFGPLASIVLVATIAYTIVRHRLFDIRLVAVRALAYLLSLVTIGIVYSLLAFGLVNTLLDAVNASIELQIFYLVVALILALTFAPIKAFFDKVTRRIFYQDAYDSQKVINNLNNILVSTVDIADVSRDVGEVLRAAIKSQYIAVLMSEVDGARSGAFVGEDKMKKLEGEAIVNNLYKYDEKLFIQEELREKRPKVAQMLRNANCAVVARLEVHDDFIGYILFGAKNNGRPYTSQDIGLINTIADELALGIQNALRFEEISKFNKTLQLKIDDATKELRKTNEQLQKLDAAKDEFVSMASHQLRTPLTSVKGYISMVLEGDAGKISSMQRKLLQEAFTSSERMVHLIGDFLNVSRLQTGKFILEKRPVNLANLVAQEIDSLHTTVAAHGLKLEYRKPTNFPVLMLDEGKIRQVLMNFIDNAIFYSQEGKTITVRLGLEAGYAVLRVVDEGIGVPKSEQVRLFAKFFRASNARRQRPDGTGVGLFLAKKVVVAHDGMIVFESEEGKGSTFGFSLPVKKLEATEKDIQASAGKGTNKLHK